MPKTAHVQYCIAGWFVVALGQPVASVYKQTEPISHSHTLPVSGQWPVSWYIASVHSGLYRDALQQSDTPFCPSMC